MSSPDLPARPPRAAAPIVFLIVFLDLLGVGIIAPLTPYIVRDFDSSGTAVALLTLSYSAAQFLATPVLGVLSDRLGRRRVLIPSILGSAAGYVLFATAGSLHLLLLSRIIDGATGGNISTAQAAIADVTPPRDRAKAYGLIGAAFGLGFLLGPTFSAVLSMWGKYTPIWAAAGLSLFTAGLVYFALPETLPPERRRREPIRARDLNPAAALLRAWIIPGVAGLLSAIFALGFAHAELRASFGVLMRDRFAYTERDAGWLFAFMGLVAIVVQGGLVRRLAPILGDRRTALIGLPLGALGYILIPFAGHAAWVFPAIGLCGLGMGLAGPPLSSLLSRAAPHDARGEVMGASQSASSLALVIGPLVAGALYDHVGFGWPFYTAGAIVLLTIILISAVREPHGHEPADAEAVPPPIAE